MLQKSQRRSGQFLAKERNERQSPINTASNPLRESPVRLARGDLSPHIIIQSPRLRGGEFESHLQKRLLQQYRHRAGFRCYCRWKSRPQGGRPQIDTELRVPPKIRRLGGTIEIIEVRYLSFWPCIDALDASGQFGGCGVSRKHG